MIAPSQVLQTWQPPATWPREQVIATSDAVLAKPAGEVNESEDIFRLSALGLDWDIGVRVYEPQPAANIARGADGKKVGIFLLHGGAGDYKSMEKFALLFAEKFAFKVVTMTFPGRLYLDDPSRDWPGDTIDPDGTVRTPIWQQRRTRHARPVRARARHRQAHEIRHAHLGARQARHALLRPHGVVAGARSRKA